MAFVPTTVAIALGASVAPFHHGRAERQNNDEGEYRIAHERPDERP